MSFDSHSLERLQQLGRQLPQPLDLPDPSIGSSKKAIGKKHPIETEDDPNTLLKELINASSDGKVPKHLINRLKETEKKQAITQNITKDDYIDDLKYVPNQNRKNSHKTSSQKSNPEDSLYISFKRLLLEED